MVLTAMDVVGISLNRWDLVLAAVEESGHRAAAVPPPDAAPSPKKIHRWTQCSGRRADLSVAEPAARSPNDQRSERRMEHASTQVERVGINATTQAGAPANRSSLLLLEVATQCEDAEEHREHGKTRGDVGVGRGEERNDDEHYRSPLRVDSECEDAGSECWRVLQLEMFETKELVLEGLDMCQWMQGMQRELDLSRFRLCDVFSRFLSRFLSCVTCLCCRGFAMPGQCTNDVVNDRMTVPAGWMYRRSKASRKIFWHKYAFDAQRLFELPCLTSDGLSGR